MKTLKKEYIKKLSSKKLYEVAFNNKKYQFRNKKLAKLVSKSDGLKNLEEIESHLIKHNAFKFNTTELDFIDTDNEKHKVTVLRASLIETWPMGTHYWIRDNTLVSDKLLNCNLYNKNEEKKLKKLGSKLLNSALVIMSSKSQLERFKNIATLDKNIDLPLAKEWPHIFMSIKENLNSSTTEAWQHKQDAWQMLAYTTLKAIKDNNFNPNNITEKMALFFGMIPLFLKRISAWEYESAGSWEELICKRSSVLVWEHALLKRLIECDKSLISLFEKKANKYLEIENYNMLAIIQEILPLIEENLINRLPMESPEYDTDSIKYRDADAALIYALELDSYGSLASSNGYDQDWVREKEITLFNKIETLRDSVTGCIKRYNKDSYQRNGYFRKDVALSLKKHFEGVSGEASSDDDFSARNKLVPKGREAFWTHFVWQLVSQYKKRVKENLKYRDLVLHNFYIGLSTFLGDEEYTLVGNDDGEVNLQLLKPYLLTECFISDEEIVFPSPHTPLQWSTGEAIGAFSTLKDLL